MNLWFRLSMLGLMHEGPELSDVITEQREMLARLHAQVGAEEDYRSLKIDHA